MHSDDKTNRYLLYPATTPLTYKREPVLVLSPAAAFSTCFLPAAKNFLMCTVGAWVWVLICRGSIEVNRVVDYTAKG